MKLIKLLIFVLAVLFTIGCQQKTHNNDSQIQIKKQNMTATVWGGDDNWYIHKDGDFRGNYEGYYRIMTCLPADNFTYKTGSMDAYTNICIEAYKQKLKSQISYRLYLLRFGYGKNSNNITIQFDDGEKISSYIQIMNLLLQNKIPKK